jgi:arylsulfatase B
MQPNILLIVLDDVGTDKLEIYGESDSPSYAQAPWCGSLLEPLPYPRTPNLAALAAGQVPGLAGGGIRFDRAYGAPVCCPARACILTGRYGFRNGLGVTDDGGGLRKRMSNAEVLLP